MITYGPSGSRRRTFVFVLTAFLLSLWSPAAAQSDSAVVSGSIRPGTPADLVIANRTIITLRAEIFSNSPAQRAENIQKRLDDILTQADQGSIRDSAVFGGRAILVDDRPLMFIAQQDLDPTMGESMDEVTALTMERLVVAIGESREVRDSSAMLWNAVFLVLYTAAFLLVLFLLRKLRGRLTRKAEDIVQRSLDRTGLKETGAHRSSTIVLVARRLGSVLIGVLMLIALYFWLTGVLDRIPVTRVWSEEMFDGVVWLALWAMSGFLSALPGLAMVAVIMLTTRWITGVVSTLFRRIHSGANWRWRGSMPPSPHRRVGSPCCCCGSSPSSSPTPTYQVPAARPFKG